VKEGTDLILAGYGLTETGTPSAPRRLQLSVTFISNNSYSIWRFERGTCAGDSGSPALFAADPRQIAGIVVAGNCAHKGDLGHNDLESIVLPIDAVRDWVTATAAGWGIDIVRRSASAGIKSSAAAKKDSQMQVKEWGQKLTCYSDKVNRRYEIDLVARSMKRMTNGHADEMPIFTGSEAGDSQSSKAPRYSGLNCHGVGMIFCGRARGCWVSSLTAPLAFAQKSSGLPPEEPSRVMVGGELPAVSELTPWTAKARYSSRGYRTLIKSAKFSSAIITRCLDAPK
jgi:hypothetical protein